MNYLTKKQGVLFYLCKRSFMMKYKECYAVLHDASRSGLARLELQRICMSRNKHVLLVTRKDIIKVLQDEKCSQSEGRGFTLTTREHQHYFLARNVTDSRKWVEAIQDTFLKPAIRVQPSVSPQQATVHENEVYGMDEYSKKETREFTVEVEENSRLKLKVMSSTVRLLVQDRHITLISMEGKRIVHWAISNMRKIGFNTDNFYLEVGSKSNYGPGYFVFETSQGKEINKLVSQEKGYLKYQMMLSRDSYTQKQTPGHARALARPYDSHPAPTASSPPDGASTASYESYPLEDLYDTITPRTSNCEDLQGQGRNVSKVSTTHSVKSLDRHIQSTKQRQTAPYTKISSQSLKILSTMKNIKSLPTHPLTADAIRGLQASSECPESDDPYSNMERIEDAWKTHGYTPDEPMEGEDEGSYDVLSYRRPVQNMELHAATGYGERVQVNESVYARVDLGKKKHRTASADDQ
ncbi:docking protein 1-like isoform X2 [Scylla paramamosain]|uniref:docking protein 1-like isoform X2 n=1 Tax=Scylla paramamosain TaxID=85552 RepID=UPI003083E342